ncbi:GNAT family N-acetyltransferase [Myroides sp. LJL119]
MQNIIKLNQIPYSSLPWEYFVDFNQRANDIPGLLEILEFGDEQQKKMALITLANTIEQKNRVLIITPMVLIYLFKFFQKQEDLQSLYLRVFLKICKAIGFQWETFLDGRNQIDRPFGTWVWQEDSAYRWPEFESSTIDQMLWATTSDSLLFDHPWYFTRQVLLSYQDLLENHSTMDLISRGILYEISTILNMIKDQQRVVFPVKKTWESENLELVPICLDYLLSYQQGLTSNVAEFLSFDPIDNQAILKEYIRRSQIEYNRGACMVFVVLNKNTKEFLGSCGIHDINQLNVEIGLWLKESAQDKGYGSEILKTLIQLIKNNIKTKYIIYNAEQKNIASIRLCEKFGFIKKYDFVIEPNVLKNKMRHMTYFWLEL